MDMAKKDKTTAKTAVASKSRRVANIIVITVVSVAVLILITIAVLCSVRIDPLDKLDRPTEYKFYNTGNTNVQPTDDETQSKLNAAVNDLDFSIMSAILQGHWNYSYKFKRNTDGDRIEYAPSDIEGISSTSSAYMIEYVYDTLKVKDGAIDYSNAKSIKVEGETIYFDRLKVVIEDTAGKVGMISLYPYVYARMNNESDIEGISSETYKTVGINVRADTTSAYSALKDIAAALAI